jgi:hypothetical protein
MEHPALSWSLINQAAETLGVSEAARKKWRSRRVPWEWRIKIVAWFGERDVTIALSDFDRLDALPSQKAA